MTGHLFQSRFGSVVMDEEHLMAAARYVALNPVRARLVERAEDWPWSSVRAHFDRGAATVWSTRRRFWRARPAVSPIFSNDEPDAEKLAALRAAEGIRAAAAARRPSLIA